MFGSYLLYENCFIFIKIMRKLSLTVFLLSYISSKEENTKFSISLMKKNAKEITPLVNLVFISFSSNEIKCRTPLLATFCQLLANMQHCPSLTLKLVSMNFFVKINTSSILKKKKTFALQAFEGLGQVMCSMPSYKGPIDNHTTTYLWCSIFK